MRFLSKQDEVMTSFTTKLKASGKRNMNGLFNVFFNRSHTRQRACNGNMLKQPAVIFSAQNIRFVRVIGKNSNDVERLRQITRDRKPHIYSRGGGGGGNNTQSEMVTPGIVTESALKSPAVTAYELITS
ncbi:MAG TPA: hypothetical protein VGG95_05990, partial [Edaphobacter sp.]